MEGLRNFRNLIDILAFNAVANTSSIHQDEHHFVEGTLVSNGDVGTVVPSNVVSCQSRTSRHHGAHARHDVHVQDGLCNFLTRKVSRKTLFPEVTETVNSFRPSFTTSVLFTPTGVTAFMYIGAKIDTQA